MAAFVYRALDASGKAVSGEIEAVDRKVAVQRLAAQGLRPVGMQPRSGTATTMRATPTAKRASTPGVATARATAAKAGGGAAGARPAAPASPARGGATKATSATTTAKAKSKGAAGPAEAMAPALDEAKVKLTRKVALGFLRKLMELLNSGMPVGDAVRLLSVRTREPALRVLATRLWRDLSEGRTLASAMQALPGRLYTDSNIHLVEAGEASGNLGSILERVVAYEDEATALRDKVQSGLAYPLFVCALAFGVACVFLYVLMPRLKEMLTRLGGELPLLPGLLVGFSEAALAFGPYVLVALVVGAMGWWGWAKTPAGREQTDTLGVRLPILGPIAVMTDVSRTSNLLATLLESGVNTTEALRLVERTIDNRYRRQLFAQARQQVQEGVSLAGAFQSQGYLPDLALDILVVGENTGNLVTSLREIAKMSRRDLASALHGLTTGITAGALIFAFALVALVALSIVTAVFSVSGSLRAGGR